MEFLIKPFLNPAVKAHIKEKNLKFDRANTFFVTMFGLVGFIGTPIYLTLTDAWAWGPWIAAVVFYWIGGLGITMGYHRYYSHRTFDAKRWVQYLMTIGGSLALENSVIKWSADHRRHHSFCDTDKDPYNAKLGFWWSHMIWIFYTDEHELGGAHHSGISNADELAKQFPNAKDLIKDPLLRWQHAYAIPFGALLCFGLPALIGWAVGGNVVAYVLVAGFTRLAFLHHSTYFINSLAHIWGRQTHSEASTARDNPWLAFLALGEGYHNYHHTYPNDYRNGIRVFDFDPTKWIIGGLSRFGQTWNLKTADKQRARAEAREATNADLMDEARPVVEV